MQQQKILVVDDEENLLALLKRVLGKEGYKVLCAQSGQDALELLQADHFDVVMVDVAMPGMHGIQLLEKLKQMYGEIPVIVTSASPSWEREREARERGCREFLPKPLDIGALKALLREILRETS